METAIFVIFAIILIIPDLLKPRPKRANIKNPIILKPTRNKWFDK